MTISIFLLVLTALGCAILARIFRWAGNRVGLHDIPDGVRKLHVKPIPVVGGLAILVAVPTTVLLAMVIDPELDSSINNSRHVALMKGLGIVLMAALGIVDDMIQLRARYKFLGQIALVELFLFGEASPILGFRLFGDTYALGPWAHLLTVFWYLFVINALNLLDGMDGMLVMISLPILVGITVMSMILGNPFTTAISLSLIGGLLGFLGLNKPPATIYMGNSGSMMMGLLIAALTLEVGTQNQQITVLPLVALLILPAIDTLAAIMRRKLTGRSLAHGDRQHLHHVLLKLHGRAEKVLRLVVALGVISTCGALLSFHMNWDAIALGTVIVMPSLLLITGQFGIMELLLLLNRFQAIWRGRRDESQLSGVRGDLSVRSVPS